MTGTFVGMPAFPAAAREALGDPQLRHNLAHATGTIRAKRAHVVAELPEWEELRLAGAAVKDTTLRSLDTHLLRLEEQLTANGATVHWARDAASLALIAHELSAGAEVALDTEGDSLHHYPERLALIQLALPDGTVWLVDPIALTDLAPLAPIFADPARTLLLHAGDNDLIHLKRRYGLTFGSVFDSAIAGRFLGLRALGLDVLLETYLGVGLPPSRQKDDWSKRPLSAAQLAYAAADVLHLFALKARLVDELARAGRLTWVEEECAALAAQPAPERLVDPVPWAGVKGARDLPPHGMAVLRELWALREELALAADRPPFKILNEETLLRIAQAYEQSTDWHRRRPDEAAWR